MKRLKIKTIAITMLFMTLLLGSCTQDILQENPKSVFTPEYFKTELGVKGGLTALYANLRYIYGQAYYYNSLETGTDHYTWAQSADGNFKDSDLSGEGTISTTSYPSSVPWTPSFRAINTASGIVENAAAVGLSADLIGEAKFFRGFYYFLLVQTYGGVPLDLGSGELKFNTSSVRTSVRNTVAEVYANAIIPDLIDAANTLPDSPRLTGAVTKTAARLYLAKAYLTYAWWLQNANNIPTYPETPRTDPAGHDAQYYFQQAYDIAATAIDSHGSFSLQPSFYDLHRGENDRNSEMLLYADHTDQSEKYNGASLGWSSASGADNAAVWMVTWNYTEIRSSGKSTVQREAAQDYGRPWTRMAPTLKTFETTFAEKTNDSRYDGTFVTVYRSNLDKVGDNNSYNNANDLPIKAGDPVLTILPTETPGVVYPSGAGPSNIGAGTLPGRADYVINPSGISRIVYPGLWKLGTYRTDNNGGLGQPNGAVTRPFPIAKLSELYFIAAEAAVKGATPVAGKSARELINVIRARAGKWKFDRAANTAKVQDNSAAMVAATPAAITIDYILEERSREYFGEGQRWTDLVRTQKWGEYAATYKIAGPTKGDHNAQTFTRTIQPFHYLRPIPQGQIDAMEGSPEEKVAYQNPGYN